MLAAGKSRLGIDDVSIGKGSAKSGEIGGVARPVTARCTDDLPGADRVAMGLDDKM
jgi:hypothetical protein